MTDLAFRPLLSRWPKPATPESERRAAKWHGGLKEWTDHLVRELEHLGVREALIEMDADPVHFKKFGGGVFADARFKSTKVMLTFDLPDVGSMVYASDGYRYVFENLHAIGLTLERLRLVDSYGATTGHQQYQGFKRLPGAGESSVEREMTAQEAAALLVSLDPQWAKFDAAVRRSVEDNVLSAAELAASVARNAVKATHPDAGGNAEQFGQVQRARAVLSKHHGGDV